MKDYSQEVVTYPEMLASLIPAVIALIYSFFSKTISSYDPVRFGVMTSLLILTFCSLALSKFLGSRKTYSVIEPVDPGLVKTMSDNDLEFEFSDLKPEVTISDSSPVLLQVGTFIWIVFTMLLCFIADCVDWEWGPSQYFYVGLFIWLFLVSIVHTYVLLINKDHNSAYEFYTFMKYSAGGWGMGMLFLFSLLVCWPVLEIFIDIILSILEFFTEIIFDL
ncbi:hypothetical protein KAJ27_13240 [bacterium]|nr:hypothetical protein [bacterium]